ncbi:MAG: sterol desaturase family protein [Spirochaetes bacterium]|nr:sterol desaturase family protein [Spirochaetota bacterium]MBU0956789.1 sterol desaturase family protein [Spirochaetota bacterium]
MEKTIAVIASLVLFTAWESLRPYYAFSKGHTLRIVANAAIGLSNVVLGRLLFSAVYAWLLAFTQTGNYGLLNVLFGFYVVKLIAAILLLDLWSYWWHRFNHTIPFLWRFHRAHHTDTEMCAVSAYRFHPVEILLSSILRMPLIFLLGVPVEALLLYEVILAVSTAFHHANLGVGARLDSLLRLVIVSPIMHKLHHSTKAAEFSSNYSSILSVWDRIFKTWTVSAQPEAITLGLSIYRHPWWQGYIGILLTPFRGSNYANSRRGG